MKVDTVAKRVGLHRKTVLCYLQAGLVPATKIASPGGGLQWDVKEVYLPLFERIHWHKMERLAQNSPALWANVRLRHDIAAGLLPPGFSQRR